MSPSTSTALKLGGLLLGVGVIIGLVVYSESAKNTVTPVALPAIAQVVNLTPSNQSVTVATSSAVVFQAPSGGSILRIQGPAGKRPETPNTQTFTVGPVNGQIVRGAYQVQYSTPAGGQFGSTYSVTITLV